MSVTSIGIVRFPNTNFKGGNGMSNKVIQKWLKENIINIKNTFHDTSDLVVRNIKLGIKESVEINIGTSHVQY